MSRKDFLGQMKALSEKGTFDAQGAPKPAGGTTTVPTNYKTSDTAAILNVHAQYQILQQELVRRNITVTKDDETAFLQSMVQRAAAQGQQTSVQQLQSQLATLEEPIKTQVDTQIAQQALGRALVTDAEAEAKARSDYDTNKAKLAQTCLSLIAASATPTTASSTSQRAATPTEADYNAAREKMQAAKAKIDSGTPFADVAKSDSDDKQSAASGGQAGCISGQELQSLPAAILDVVNNQPLNKASDPVRLEGRGYALFLITSRDTPTFDKVKNDLVTQAREELAQDRVAAAVKEAQRRVPVTVDPLFGKWDVTRFEVVAPPGAEQPATSLPNPDTALLPGGAGAITPDRSAAAPPTSEPSTTSSSTTGGTTGTAPSGTARSAASSTAAPASVASSSTTSAPSGTTTAR